MGHAGVQCVLPCWEGLLLGMRLEGSGGLSPMGSVRPTRWRQLLTFVQKAEDGAPTWKPRPELSAPASRGCSLRQPLPGLALRLKTPPGGVFS